MCVGMGNGGKCETHQWMKEGMGWIDAYKPQLCGVFMIVSYSYIYKKKFPFLFVVELMHLDYIII
jgi:hypothetical protein